MTQPVKLARLTEDQLRQIEQKLRPLAVAPDSTEITVAFTLGQQSVLKLLRDGFTIGT